MMDFSGPMRDLMAVDGAEPSERVQAWRRVMMGVYTAAFGDGYAANESDASVRAALAYNHNGIRFTPAPSTPGEAIDERPAAQTDTNGNGGTLEPNSTLIH